MRYNDPRDVSQPEGSISAREYKALKIALMNPGVLNRRAVFPPKFQA